MKGKVGAEFHRHELCWIREPSPLRAQSAGGSASGDPPDPALTWRKPRLLLAPPSGTERRRSLLSYPDRETGSFLQQLGRTRPQSGGGVDGSDNPGRRCPQPSHHKQEPRFLTRPRERARGEGALCREPQSSLDHQETHDPPARHFLKRHVAPQTFRLL